MGQYMQPIKFSTLALDCNPSTEVDNTDVKGKRNPTCTRKSDLKTSVTIGIEEQEDEGWSTTLDRKNIVLNFLKKKLNESLLKRYQTRVEVLSKCSYYIEILSRQLAVGDQSTLMFPITMLQFIDSCKLQRMKKIGTSQTKIQLLLLEEFLEQLQKGRADLLEMVQSYDNASFLTNWKAISQYLSEMARLLDNFPSMLLPGQLYIKHHLIPNIGATKIPTIRIVLRAETPVMFDREESVAHENWVSLKWHALGQQTQADKYELCFKILKEQTTQDWVQSGTIFISANSLKIHNLLQDQMYEFSIRRAETYMLVYEAWHDVITLRTQATKAQRDTKCHTLINYKSQSPYLHNCSYTMITQL